MAYRPTWQGHLRLSLVTCPVAMYTATNSGGDVHFNLINPKTNNRIKMITTDPDTGPRRALHLVKGYEVSKGEYILLTDEEIKSVKLESTKTIDIERFVPAEDIDRIYWDNPYYLVPDGKLAQEAFGVIREAMERSGQIALGRVVMSTRERCWPWSPAAKASWPIRCAPTPRCARPTRCLAPSATRPRPSNDRYRRKDHRAEGRSIRSQPVQRSL
jgi:DNA end-binding protein Ku